MCSVVGPHHCYAALARGKNFDAAPAPTPLFGKPKFLKGIKLTYGHSFFF
jgi:hypothetical protein